MFSTNSIATERLTMTIPEPEDYESLIRIMSDPVMTMYRETDFSATEITMLLNDSCEALKNGKIGLRVIRDKSSNEIIGLGGVKKGFLIDHEIYESLMYLVREYWGKGYAKEALYALMKEAFAGGVEEIHSFINMENYNMQFLLESLGYIKKGDETINLNYNIVTRAHYTIREHDKKKKTADDLFFVNF